MTNPLSKTNYRWLILLSISMIAFVINGDYLAVNFALVSITSDFHSSLHAGQWILSGYMLSWATLVIPAGKLLDKYSSKGMCVMGISIFLIASTLAGLSSSITMLISARILQGVGGAVFLPTIYSMIYANFSESERGRAMGIIGLAVGLGLALGPVMGGLFLTWVNWQSIFFINIPIGLIAIGIIYKGSASDQKSSQVMATSWGSVFLIALASVASLLLLSFWQQWSDYPLFYSGFAAAIVAILFFFLYLEKHLSVPLIPPVLLKNYSYWGCCLGILLVEYSFSTIVVSIGLYLQNVLHLTPLLSSNIFLSMSIIFGLIAALGGSWVDKVGFKIPAVLGLSITAVMSPPFFICFRFF